jgi:hypothetical protein
MELAGRGGYHGHIAPDACRPAFFIDRWGIKIREWINERSEG